MLRLLLPILVTTAASGAAFGADPPAFPAPGRYVKAKAAHVDRAPPPLPAAAVERDPDALISPSLPTTPILLGSQTLPSDYGSAFDYDYQGAYYGGPNPSHLFRLPYACGIYGYC